MSDAFVPLCVYLDKTNIIVFETGTSELVCTSGLQIAFLSCSISFLKANSLFSLAAIFNITIFNLFRINHLRTPPFWQGFGCWVLGPPISVANETDRPIEFYFQYQITHMSDFWLRMLSENGALRAGNSLARFPSQFLCESDSLNESDFAFFLFNEFTRL